MAAGALTLAASGGEPGRHFWARTDPVHLRLMRDRLIVVPSAAFSLSLEEARALAEALNRHFAGRLAIEVVDPGRWCARLEETLAFHADPPLAAAGRDVDLALRGGGEAARRWGTLLNEAQMLLHAHPVNQEREARGEPVVNSLWLWGAGRRAGSAGGALAERSRGRSAWRSGSPASPARVPAACPRTRRPSSSASPQDGRHLLLLDALRAPLALGHSAEYRERIDTLEKNWFAPLLAALRRGRVGMVTLHVPDSLGASFETIRGDLRRFWRRPRALEKYA